MNSSSGAVDARPFTFLLVLLVLTLLAWPDLFLARQVPVDGNVLRLFYPDWAFLHAHPPGFSGWPLWNPTRNMGEPFLADPQSLAGYPPAWLLCRLPDYLAFVRIWILGHTLLAGYFMRKWALQTLGDPAAAAAATVVIGFNGYFVAHGTLLNHFAAAAYLPAALYAFAARRPVALGAAMALQWLAGFPPFSYLTAIALLGWALLAGPARSRLLDCLWRAGLIAVGLAAFQLIPFIELFVQSARPALLSPEVATEFSEPAGQLLRMLLVPQWPAWSRALTGDQAIVTFYVGPVVLLAAIWAVVKGGRSERLVLGATFTCALLSLGAYLPGYAIVPPFRLFRFPANWLLVTAIGCAWLAGAGICRFTNPRRKWAVAALMLGDLLLFARHPRTPWFNPSFLDDPPPVAQSQAPQASTARIYHEPGLINDLARQPSKVFTDWLFFKNALVPSYGTAFGLREVSSYQVLKLARAARYQARLASEGLDSPLARWAGISAVVRRGRLDSTVPSPRADYAAVVGQPGDELQALVYFLKDGNPPLFFEHNTDLQRVAILRQVPGGVEAGVTSDRADTLVFSEVSYPGWHVTLDGRPSSLEVFQETFMATQVPAGSHTVQFTYAPLSVRAGTGVTVLTLGGLVFGLIFRSARSPNNGDRHGLKGTKTSR